MMLLVSSLLATLTSVVLVFLNSCKPRIIAPAEVDEADKEPTQARNDVNMSDGNQTKKSSSRLYTIKRNFANPKYINISSFIICLLSTLAANLFLIYPNVTLCQ